MFIGNVILGRGNRKFKGLDMGEFLSGLKITEEAWKKNSRI